MQSRFKVLKKLYFVYFTGGWGGAEAVPAVIIATLVVNASRFRG